MTASRLTPMLKRIRRSVVHQIRRHGVQIRRMPPSLATDRGEIAIDLTIEHLVTLHLVDPVPGFFFVQVGAFDGITNDPINRMVRRYDWAGVLAEPQPAAFERLTKTYAEHPKLQLRNAAVGDRDGTVALYCVRDAPAWVDQLASLDRDVILRHDRPGLNLSSKIVSTKVDLVTFDSLLRGVDRVDLLQIDAEGSDGLLIDMFDLARWQPSIIQFEHRHLSLDEHEAALRRLIAHGYRIATARFDTLAYRDRRLTVRSRVGSPGVDRGR
jgi:FkbM family methyltransferase